MFATVASVLIPHASLVRGQSTYHHMALAGVSQAVDSDQNLRLQTVPKWMLPERLDLILTFATIEDGTPHSCTATKVSLRIPPGSVSAQLNHRSSDRSVLCDIA